MKKIAILLFVTLLTGSVGAVEKSHSGLTIHSSYNKERGSSIDVYYWYPIEAEHTDYVFGNSRVFDGIKARLNAKIAPGKFPVIALAHGGLRSSFTHTGWVASSLAREGYIVVVPKPPSSGETEPGQMIDELWFRPSDLSTSLTSLERIEMFNGSINQDDIFGVGFFLGGTSMLSLAGAKISFEKYKQSCSTDGINQDCSWFARNAIDLSSISGRYFSKNARDNRIKAVIAINPELTKTLAVEELERIRIPIRIIDLLGKTDHPLEPSASLESIPDFQSVVLDKTTAFSTFSRCTEKGKQILALENEADICNEPEEVSRKMNHQRIIKAILTALRTGNH